MDSFCVMIEKKYINFFTKNLTTYATNLMIFYKEQIDDDSFYLKYLTTDDYLSYKEDDFDVNSDKIMFRNNEMFVKGKRKFLSESINLIDYKLNTLNIQVEKYLELNISELLIENNFNMIYKFSKYQTNNYYTNLMVFSPYVKNYKQLFLSLLTSTKPNSDYFKEVFLYHLYKEMNLDIIKIYIEHIKDVSSIVKEKLTELNIFLINNCNHKSIEFYEIIDLFLKYDKNFKDSIYTIQMFCHFFYHNVSICYKLINILDIKQANQVCSANNSLTQTSFLNELLVTYYDLIEDKLERQKIIKILLEKGLDPNTKSYLIAPIPFDLIYFQNYDSYADHEGKIQWMGNLDISYDLEDVLLEYGAKVEENFKNYEKYWINKEKFDQLYSRKFDKNTFINSCYFYNPSFSRQKTENIYYKEIIELEFKKTKRINIQGIVFDTKELRDIIASYV